METGACGRLLKQISDEMEKNGNNAMRAQNMTMSQMGALLELDVAPEKQLSLKELEKRLHVAQSTAAGIVARLEQKGFVDCRIDFADRRIKLVNITPAGQECVHWARRNIAQAEARLLSGLTQAEQETFYVLLKKVRNALN